MNQDLINVYQNDQPTSQVLPREEVHKQGLWHATVHIWIVSPKQGILMQQRSAYAKVGALGWGPSAYGHVHAGEQVLDACVRKVQEELGVPMKAAEFKFAGIIKADEAHDGIIDRELRHVFLVIADLPAATLSIDQRQIMQVNFVPPAKFWGMVERMPRSLAFSPQYFKELHQVFDSFKG